MGGGDAICTAMIQFDAHELTRSRNVSCYQSVGVRWPQDGNISCPGTCRVPNVTHQHHHGASGGAHLGLATATSPCMQTVDMPYTDIRFDIAVGRGLEEPSFATARHCDCTLTCSKSAFTSNVLSRSRSWRSAQCGGLCSEDHARGRGRAAQSQRALPRQSHLLQQEWSIISSTRRMQLGAGSLKTRPHTAPAPPRMVPGRECGT